MGMADSCLSSNLRGELAGLKLQFRAINRLFTLNMTVIFKFTPLSAIGTKLLLDFDLLTAAFGLFQMVTLELYDEASNFAA